MSQVNGPGLLGGVATEMAAERAFCRCGERWFGKLKSGLTIRGVGGRSEELWPQIWRETFFV